MTSLVDRFGRRHQDLRVSLTDRCSFRCGYCMPAAGLSWQPSNGLLTTSEIVRLVRIAVAQGIANVRLTGGEPLLHPDVLNIAGQIASLPNAPQITVTTNGVRLPGLAARLRDAGVSRVNVSLDTLDRDTFARITRRDRLIDVLAGISAAQAAGLNPVKINAVLLRDVNEQEAPALLTWALRQGVQLRFIEQMPLDPGHTWNHSAFVTADEVLASLQAAGFALRARAGRGSAPAQLWDVTGGPGVSGSIGVPGTVGIIASVTAPFCRACDRLRLTADGQWRNCLFATRESDLRSLLRAGASDDDVAVRMCGEVTRKAAGHEVNDPAFVQPDRPMSAIGG